MKTRWKVTALALPAAAGLAWAMVYPGLMEVAPKERIALSELKNNLRVIRTLQIVHLTDRGTYVGNQGFTPLPDRVDGPGVVVWDPATRFSILGFAPGDGVRCSYALEGPDWPGEDEGFVARAECDLDGDGAPSRWSISGAGEGIAHGGAPY